MYQLSMYSNHLYFSLDYTIPSNGYIRGTAPRKQTFTYEGQSFDIDFSGIFTDANGANSNVQPIVFDTHLPVGCCNQNGQNLEDLAKDSSFTCNLSGCTCQVSDICGNGDIDLIVGDQRKNAGIYKSSDTCRNDEIDRPFAGYGNGNANDSTRDPRYVLVIPEHPFKSGDGCFAPDDNRYGGYIELDFSDPMQKGLDFLLMGGVKLLDIEDATEGDTKATLYRYSSKLGERVMAGIGDNSVVERSFTDISDGSGFSNQNLVNPTRLKVHFEGSGSLGPISFKICKPKSSCN